MTEVALDRKFALQDLPILKFLPEDARALFTNSFRPVRYAFGSVIVREGDPADALFVLVSGRARVLKLGPGGEEVSLNDLRPGDTFGETALLEQSTRTA